MRPVLQLRTQNAYNCGAFSIWMALESLHGVNDNLITAIEKKAKAFSNSAGGLFRYYEIMKVILSLDYNAEAVSFHDRTSFINGLNAHANDAILIAYSFYGLDGRVQSEHVAAGSAHWSVADRCEGGYVRLANPHGNLKWISVDTIVRANLDLGNGSFHWAEFVGQYENTPLFNQETALYTTSAADLRNRVHEQTDLSGYFIAISG